MPVVCIVVPYLIGMTSKTHANQRREMLKAAIFIFMGLGIGRRQKRLETAYRGF